MENLTNITSIETLISNKSSELINKTLSQIFYKIKPILTTILIIILILIILYITYRIIKFFLARNKEKRIKNTYNNTELILEKLNKIEEKINKLTEKPIIERKAKKKEKTSPA